jgi:hypothetical protein
MLLNLTPHPITVIADDGTATVSIAPAGPSPRVREEHALEGAVTTETGAEVPVSAIRYTSIDGLPDRQDDTFLIVSMLVAQAAPDRDDLLVPIGQVRDDQGRIIGCRGLGRLRPRVEYVMHCTRINDDPHTADNGRWVTGSDGRTRRLDVIPTRPTDEMIRDDGWQRIGPWTVTSEAPRHVEAPVVPLDSERGRAAEASLRTPADDWAASY